MEPGPRSGPALRRPALENVLSRQIELAGKSGARYRYTPLQEERFLPPAGANFVIAKLTKELEELLQSGAAAYLPAGAVEVPDAS